jgi:uncharacterized membrane protein
MIFPFGLWQGRFLPGDHLNLAGREIKASTKISHQNLGSVVITSVSLPKLFACFSFPVLYIGIIEKGIAMKARYDYSSHRSQAAAEAALEEYFATGEVSACEHPKVQRRVLGDGVAGQSLFRYYVTLED